MDLIRDSRNGALSLLRGLGKEAEDLKLSVPDQLDALADSYGSFSITGIYYRVQWLIVRCTTVVGGILFPLLGVLFAIQLLRAGSNWVGKQENWDKVKKWLKIAAVIAVPAGAIAGAAWWASRRDEDGRCYDDDVTAEDVADVLNYGVKLLVPAPVLGLVQILEGFTSSALANTGSTSAGLTSLTQTVKPIQNTASTWLGLGAQLLSGVLNKIGLVDAQHERAYDSVLPLAAGEAVFRAAVEMGCDPETLTNLAAEQLAGTARDEVTTS